MLRPKLPITRLLSRPPLTALSLANATPRRSLTHLPFPRPQASLPRTSQSIKSQTRDFSSSTARQARYVKFQGDPERPWDVSKWDFGTKVAAAVVAGGVVYYVTHLEQVPETGRWRFMDVNPKYETKLAEAARDEILSEYKGKILPPNHPITRHVRRVLTRLLEGSDLGTLKSSAPPTRDPQGEDGLWNPDGESGRTEDVAPGVGGREWELMVVNDDKIVNAAASYGNVIVFTGILPVAKNEEGLAAVLGHEIGHVVARHNSERYSSVKILLFLTYLLDIAGLDFGIARLTTTLLLDLPNSRKLEYEADKLGLRICAKACYDPHASPEMFARLAKLEGGRSTDFLYTHPTSEKRIKELEAMLPEAYSLRAASPQCGGVSDAFSAFNDAFASGFSGSRWT